MTTLITAQASVTDSYTKFASSTGHTIRIDSEGRWCSFRQGQDFYQRTLRGEAVLKDNRLSPADSQKLENDIANMLDHYIKELGSNNLDLELLGSYVELQKKLQLTLQQMQSASSIRQQFDNTYAEPVPILPPDRYRDVVVLPATGCPNARCSFCAFYQDEPFKSVSIGDFEHHLQQVKQLLGSSINERGGFFLGSANALALPQKKILPVLDVLRQQFGTRKHGVASFFDPEHAPKRQLDDWLALADRGLVYLVIGLETGVPELRKKIGKSDQLNILSDAISIIKQVGINVGLTVLIGIGEQVDVKRQIEATASYIASLKLESTDKIYLSPYSDSHWSDLDVHYIAFKSAINELSAVKTIHYSMHKYGYFF